MAFDRVTLINKSFLFLIVLGYALSFAAFSSDPDAFDATSEVSAQNLSQAPTNLQVTKLEALTYTVRLLGLESKVVRKNFDARSHLENFKDRQIYSRFALEKRVQDDLKLLSKLYLAYGFYDATVVANYEKVDGNTQVQFVIDEGNRYRISALHIEFRSKPGDPAPCQEDFEDLGLEIGSKVNAGDILDAFEKFRLNLANCGYPFAVIQKHEAFVNRDQKTIFVELIIDPGPFVRFGLTTIDNNSNVIDSYIENRSTFEEGDTFDQSKLDKYREKLSASRVFESVIVDGQQEAFEDGKMPVLVHVRPRKQRSISGGAKYGLEDGFSITADWTHHNLSGRADKLRLSTQYGQEISKVDLNYELPDVYLRNQKMILAAEWHEEDTEAFDSRGYGANIGFNYEFRENWFFKYGLSYTTSRVFKNNEIFTSDVIGIPLGFEIDTRKNRLDPKSGGQFKLDVTPEYGNIGNTDQLVRKLLYGSYHIGFGKKGDTVLALWARAGSISGAPNDDISPDRRFYMGGGGSIRGYGYQLAGFLDEEGRPLGGKSKLEFGIEPRFRFNPTWGAVAFFEGGILSRRSFPTFDEQFFFGYGAGVRYYTGFGPIRADIAFPNRRRVRPNGKRADRPLQVYVSIGQSF